MIGIARVEISVDRSDCMCDRFATTPLLSYGRGMAGEGYLIARQADSLSYYEERARREEAAAEAASNPQIASVHRLLAIQYAAEARELRKQLAKI